MGEVPEGIAEQTTSRLFRSTPSLADMPPLIITCATTGGFDQSQNPNLPQTAEEQAETAAQALEAGASIIHIHGRRKDDPRLPSNEAARYQEINRAIRERAPEIIIDNTQTIAPLIQPDRQLIGDIYHWKTAPMHANPEIIALNPGPMTFRGNGQRASSAYVTTFDDTLQTAIELRERGIKPQLFLYHPGHLDLFAYLLDHDALAPPYFVQLVFGQQSGIPYTPESVLYMVRHLPENTIYQTCALELDEIEVNLYAILLGGHVRTGMEDTIYYRRDEHATGNRQFVERIVRIATDIGRRIATPAEARAMLGLGAPSTYEASTSEG
jgi:3-keto-5-aminohexanoate cleavage enzyme